MSETRDMMAAPGGSAPLHQRIDSMQVGCLPLVTMVTGIIGMCAYFNVFLKRRDKPIQFL